SWSLLLAITCSSPPSRQHILRSKGEGEHLIFTQGYTARETNKTQAFPTISAIWASGRWVCLGLLGAICRTQFGHRPMWFVVLRMILKPNGRPTTLLS